MIQLVLWEQKIFEFGLEIQSPFALPLPSIEWGGAKFPLVAQCPGAAFCGNPKPSVHCAVSKVINIPIPKFGITLPTLTIAIPSFKFKFVFPPKVIIPINCPNYPGRGPVVC